MNMFELPFKKEHRLFVVSGPSGVGKSTVTTELFKTPEIKESVAYSISATTRPPRPGEREGVNYFFVTQEKFDSMAAAGEFLEWAQVHDHVYGTPRSNIERAFSAGKDLYLEIDVQGALNVRAAHPDAVLIFITAPPDVFRARLENRPSALTGDELRNEIEIRMNTARRELALLTEYDYCVINDKLDECVKTVISIMFAERCRVPSSAKGKAPDLSQGEG